MKWQWNLADSLKCFSGKLMAWNRDTFGNIFQMKIMSMLRLEGVQRALDRNVTRGLLKLEEKLRKEKEKTKFCRKRSSCGDINQELSCSKRGIKIQKIHI